MTLNPSWASRRRILFLMGCLAMPLSMATPAFAGQQVAVSHPASVETPETSKVIMINFSIIDTGVPLDYDAKLDSITLFVTPVFGDTANDVLKVGNFETNDCSGELVVGEACTEFATYNVRDADPFDDDKTVDEGLWTAGISVKWHIGDKTGISFGSTYVSVLDDVPETSTWVMMMVGLGGVGVLTRGRRGQAPATV